jgi:hypothetical protein
MEASKNQKAGRCYRVAAFTITVWASVSTFAFLSSLASFLFPLNSLSLATTAASIYKNWSSITSFGNQRGGLDLGRGWRLCLHPEDSEKHNHHIHTLPHRPLSPMGKCVVVFEFKNKKYLATRREQSQPPRCIGSEVKRRREQTTLHYSISIVQCFYPIFYTRAALLAVALHSFIPHPAPTAGWSGLQWLTGLTTQTIADSRESGGWFGLPLLLFTFS